MTSDAGLDAAFTVGRGDFSLTIELAVPVGRVTAVVGPNGAGKSTALRTIAGLLRPHSGRITSSDRVLDDVAFAVHLPPAKRGIGVMFQDYLLFPHLTAVENVAFGPMARGIQRRPALARAHDWLDRLGVEDLALKRPASLSGGQAQRVALGRALVLEPSLLLLDEPLAALDASTRLDVRSDLAGVLGRYGGATVLVTHDPVDAIALADEIVVLERGAVVQRGTPAEVTRAPQNTYVADLLGLNLLGTAGRRSLVFSPADVTLSVQEPTGSVAMVERCIVRGLEEASGRIRVRLSTVARQERIAAEVDAREFAVRPVAPGDEVWASVPPSKLRET